MRRSADMTLRRLRRVKIKNKDSEKPESRVLEKAEVCIIRMTEEIREQNINKSIKNEFFIRRARTASKKKLIIFSENASLFSTFFFSKSRNSERMKKITII